MPSIRHPYLTSEGVVDTTEIGVEGSPLDATVWPWDQIFGVVLLPKENPTSAYVLVPKQGEPWVRIPKASLATHETLQELASTIRQRCTSSGYRNRQLVAEPLPKDILFQKILDRQEVPGALTVPVGTGPGFSRRWADVMTGVSMGTSLGLLGASLGLPLLGVAAGVAGGVVLPIGVSSLRARKKLRVLVLAPDGCVVGLPSGPAVYSWTELSVFSEEPLIFGSRRSCLELQNQEEEVLGRIDSAWFTKPLPLIVGLANAYRKRFASRS